MTFWAVKKASRAAVVLTAIHDLVIERENDLIRDQILGHLLRAERDEAIVVK